MSSLLSRSYLAMSLATLFIFDVLVRPSTAYMMLVPTTTAAFSRTRKITLTSPICRQQVSTITRDDYQDSSISNLSNNDDHDTVENHSNNNDNNDDDAIDDEDIEFLFKEPEIPYENLDVMEKVWRHAKKPLLRIGSKGATHSHGNSLRQLLDDHTVVKVKVNTRKFGKW
jgi:hypothetical protein